MRISDWSSDVCSSDLATPKEFARMVRKIIEADQLPEYTMTITKTTEGAPAALFELRGAAEAAALHVKLEADRERRERAEEIGRAHVRHPVSNAHLVCRLLSEKKKK